MADPRQTALVTGCSAGGIGHSIAREFNSRGVRTFATVRNKVSFPDDLTAEGIEGISLTVDDPESVRQCFEEVERLTGGKGLDFLVNNAGRNYTVPALDIDMSEVQGVFDTNVFGVMRMCQVFSPLLIKAKGTIVQTGSLAGVMPYVFGSVYNASKAALHAYSNTLRVELAPFGVKVVTVVTGGVKSNIARVTRSLPPDSYYLEIDDSYQRRQKHSQENSMKNEDYARSVVGQVMRGTGRRWIWEGHMSWVVWFVTTWLPTVLIDTWMTRTFGLDRLRGGGVDKKRI